MMKGEVLRLREESIALKMKRKEMKAKLYARDMAEKLTVDEQHYQEFRMMNE